jgi:hypothetical protein
MNFQTIQKEFSAYIRNPETNKKPEGIEDRRLKIYSELFYNNVESFVSRAFPVIRKMYSDNPSSNQKWHEMVREFFETHQSQSPYFSDISKEFLIFLQEERNNPDDPPFLLELAHYEWVELALDISQEEIPIAGFNPQGDLLKSQVYISPLAWLLHYQWPVHLIGPNFQPQQIQQPYFVVVYRNSDYQINFMELNAISARLLSIIQENQDLTGTQAITQLSNELINQGNNNFTLNLLLEKGEETLNHLKTKQIILGTR